MLRVEHGAAAEGRIGLNAVLYPVINRGKLRAEVSASKATREALERYLREAYEKSQWQLDALDRYRTGSYGSLRRANARPSFLSFDAVLIAAGGLADQKAGRNSFAGRLKSETTRSTPWIAGALQMGAHAGISRYVTEFRFGQRPAATVYFNRISSGEVWPSRARRYEPAG